LVLAETRRSPAEKDIDIMATFNGGSLEYGPQTEAFEAEQFEWGEAELGMEAEVFTEAELMELAGELVGVTSEAELDLFLGDLINRAGRALGQVVRSPVGQAVGGLLKGAAKKALPLAGAALGGYVGGPLGAQIGSGLASAAGSALGLEAEMMNAEDREFEGAKKFVQMAGQAVKSAVTAPPSVSPMATAQSAVIAAAKKLAPGLLKETVRSRVGRAGRWVRHGRNIIIVNCQ
jgi:hypothetical protein